MSLVTSLSENRWSRLWQRAGLAGDGTDAATFAQLTARYAEPQRHYHNAAHIAECLAWLDDCTSLVADPVAIEFALWFHDAVYDPRSSDNEERSADLATETLRRAGADPALVGRVAALILTTKSHTAAGQSDAPWLLDIDLAVLARPRATFLEYEVAIRAEYAWVPLETYCEKRAAILTHFLSRPHLFLTAHFAPRFEAVARANVAFSIAALRAGSIPA